MSSSSPLEASLVLGLRALCGTVACALVAFRDLPFTGCAAAAAGGAPDAAATAVADNDRPGTFALLCAPWVWRLGGGGERDRRGRELAFTAVGGEDGGDGDVIVRCAGTCHPCSRSGGGIAPGGNLGDPAPALLGLAERGGCWATGVLPGLP